MSGTPFPAVRSFDRWGAQLKAYIDEHISGEIIDGSATEIATATTSTTGVPIDGLTPVIVPPVSHSVIIHWAGWFLGNTAGKYALADLFEEEWDADGGIVTPAHAIDRAGGTIAAASGILKGTSVIERNPSSLTRVYTATLIAQAGSTAQAFGNPAWPWPLLAVQA